MESNFTQRKKNICNYYLKNILRAVANVRVVSTLRVVADPRSGLLERRGVSAKGLRAEWKKGRRGEGVKR